MPAAEIRAPEVENLALLDQDLESLPHLLPGGFAVHVVHLVEVDMVRPQALQGRLAGLADVKGGQPPVVGPVAHGVVKFCGKNDLFASASALVEPASDDPLGQTLAFLPAVNVRSVKEIDPEFQGA